MSDQRGEKDWWAEPEDQWWAEPDDQWEEPSRKGADDGKGQKGQQKGQKGWWIEPDEQKGQKGRKERWAEPEDMKGGKSWRQPSRSGPYADHELQRPKGKGGKWKQGKPEDTPGEQEDLPPLRWVDGRVPDWNKPAKKVRQEHDPHRVAVILEEVDGAKRGKILLCCYLGKKWTLPSMAVDPEANLLGTADMPNMPEWMKLARQAVQDYTGISEEVELSLRHYGVFGVTRYIVLSGSIGAALTHSYIHRTNHDVHRTAFFELGDDGIFPTYANVEAVLDRVQNELRDGKWTGAQPKPAKKTQLCRTCTKIMENLLQKDD